MTQASRWISVTEKLPDDKQDCWTFAPINEVYCQFDPRVSVHRYYLNYANMEQWWMHRETNGNNYPFMRDNGTIHITHWMPFERPEPPLEEQDG